jgi:hypothetical protein
VQAGVRADEARDPTEADATMIAGDDHANR